tara:strand:+ start:399 stop:560 length:162 start_codon:yes stop_codon:yes gene_type:complete
MNKQILFEQSERVKAHQIAMAENVAKLTNKKAQKQQVHLLCDSLKQSINARGK